MTSSVESTSPEQKEPVLSLALLATTSSNNKLCSSFLCQSNIATCVQAQSCTTLPDDLFNDTKAEDGADQRPDVC